MEVDPSPAPSSSVVCSPCKGLIAATGAGECWKNFSESTQCCLSFVPVKPVSGQGRTDVKIPPKKGLLFVDPADPPQPHLACRAPAALFFSSKRMLTLEKRAQTVTRDTGCKCILLPVCSRPHPFPMEMLLCSWCCHICPCW